MQAETIAPRLKLKALRKAFGTQKKVAADLAITETHLREIESGRSTPGTKLLKRMEHYFGASDEELFPDIHNESYYASN